MMRRGDCRTLAVRAAAFFALVTVQLAGLSHADWSDNFNGNTTHNPTNGAWGYLALSLAATPVEVPGWNPVLSNDRVNVPSPTMKGLPLYLAAGYVYDTTGTSHRYGDVRVAGTVGVGNNSGQGNNNLVGLLARAADFDSYVLAVDHRTGTVNLIKSLDANPNAPTTMTSQPILGYAPTLQFHLVLDVLNTPTGGTQLVGRVYENSSKTNLLNTISAFDDAGNVVPGAPHAPYYSGWVAQYNTAAGASATFVDAYFDNMSSTTLRPGDVDLNGTVNRADVAKASRGFGKLTGATWDDGDMDGNGTVDMADIIRIQNRLAGSGPIIINPPIDVARDAIAAVPEPGSIALVAMGAIGVAVAARRRRSK
jgi:hypothetical protein